MRIAEKNKDQLFLFQPVVSMSGGVPFFKY